MPTHVSIPIFQSNSLIVNIEDEDQSCPIFWEDESQTALGTIVRLEPDKRYDDEVHCVYLGLYELDLDNTDDGTVVNTSQEESSGRVQFRIDEDEDVSECFGQGTKKGEVTDEVQLRPSYSA